MSLDAITQAWIFYILGAGLTLAWKLGRYLYGAKAHNKTIKESAIDWFFDKSAENAISWITTIAVVWVCGTVYITRVGVPFSDWLNSIPLDNSFSFLLGSVMEIAAPNAAKWVISMLPGGK